MRTQLVVGLALGALGIVTVACSTSSSGSSNPYPDVTHFCAAVAQAECGTASTGAISNCSLPGSTASTCVAFRTSECEKGSIVMPGAAFGNRTLTSGNVQACLDAINAAFDTANVTVLSYATLYGADGNGGLVATCEQVFVGAVATGSTCTSSYDCATSTDICAADPQNPTASSQCAVPRPQAIAGMCRDIGDTCTGGYCSSKSLCVALLPDGATCTAGQCLASSRCAAGICAARGAAGDACASNDDCDPTVPLLCDVYRTGGSVCAKAVDLVNGSKDCTGYLQGEGLGEVGGTDAGGGDTGSSSGGDTGTGGDSSSTDATSGG